MSESRVIQIANVYGKTGIGNYSRWVNAATYDLSRMYLLNKSDTSAPGKEVERVVARKLPFTSNWWFENHLPRIAYGKFKKELNTIMKDGGTILHSLSHMVQIINKDIDVVTFHDLISLKMPDNYKPEFAKLLKTNFKKYSKVDHAITTTNYVKKDLEDYGYSGEVHVIGYPVDPVFRDLNDKQFSKKSAGLPLDKKIILSVSSTEPRKNLRIIQELMGTLPDDFILVRVGDGISADKIYRNLGPTELNLLYNSADVFLSTSLEEGFGLPTIEAMACGLPVVLSDREFFREVAKNAAIFVDPLSVQSVKVGIDEALSNSNIFREKGKERAGYFSFEEFAASMRKLYASVLNN